MAQVPLDDSHFDMETVSGLRESERQMFRQHPPPPLAPAMPERARESNALEAPGDRDRDRDREQQQGPAAPTMDTVAPLTTVPLAPLPAIHAGLPITDDEVRPPFFHSSLLFTSSTKSISH